MHSTPGNKRKQDGKEATATTRRNEKRKDSLEVEIEAQDESISNLALPQSNDPSNDAQRAENDESDEDFDDDERVDESVLRGGRSSEGEGRELGDVVRVTEKNGSDEEEDGSEDFWEERRAEEDEREEGEKVSEGANIA